MLNNHNAAVNLGEGIVKLIDATAIEKDHLLIIVDSEAMDTSHESYQ